VLIQASQLQIRNQLPQVVDAIVDLTQDHIALVANPSAKNSALVAVVKRDFLIATADFARLRFWTPSFPFLSRNVLPMAFAAIVGSARSFGAILLSPLRIGFGGSPRASLSPYFKPSLGVLFDPTPSVLALAKFSFLWRKTHQPRSFHRGSGLGEATALTGCRLPAS
jgi:hypothetical protein